MHRLLLALLAGACLLVAFGRSAEAQVAICSGTGFVPARGTTACDGTSRPVTVSANVKTYARVALEEVFGSPAASLQVAMGDVDANCIGAPASGVRCVADVASGAATWYGDVRMRVKLAGLGAAHGKLTGVMLSGATMPSGRLLDGAAGAAPTSAYPVAPATAADLVTGLPAGDTIVTRSLGVKVVSADPPGAWSASTVYSLVLE